MVSSKNNLACLHRPLVLPCGVTVKNRLAKAAMTEGLADAHNRATDRHRVLYDQWAAGGAGLLITGNLQVDRLHLERAGNVVIDGPLEGEHRMTLSAWAAAATRDDTHCWVQLSHAGRQTPAIINPTPEAPSPVAVQLPGKQFGQPVAITRARIEQMVERFANAASLVKECGFTGVQIHAAHGYLLSSFLSPLSNRRSDDYGGSLRNRARFLRRVVAAVRAAVGQDYPLSVKLNSADFQRGGFSEDDALKVAEWLQEDGIDLLEISGGTYEQPKMMNQTGMVPAADPRQQRTKDREAYFQAFAARLRARLTMPIMVTGGFRRVSGMSQAITRDGVDLIGLGRPLCVDPDAPARLLGGEVEELPRWETVLGSEKGLFSRNSSVPIFKAAAAWAIQSWYYKQIFRLADGKSADRHLGVWSALWSVQRHERQAARALFTARENL